MNLNMFNLICLMSEVKLKSYSILNYCNFYSSNLIVYKIAYIMFSYANTFAFASQLQPPESK